VRMPHKSARQPHSLRDCRFMSVAEVVCSSAALANSFVVSPSRCVDILQTMEQAEGGGEPAITGSRMLWISPWQRQRIHCYTLTLMVTTIFPFAGGSAGGFAIYQLKHDSGGQGETWILLTLVALVVSGFCYIMASVRGENAPSSNSSADAEDSSKTGAAKEPKSGGGGGGGLFGFGGKKETASAAGTAAVVGALAPSLGQQMFGGGGGDAESMPSPAVTSALIGGAVAVAAASGPLLTRGAGEAALGAWLDDDEGGPPAAAASVSSSSTGAGGSTGGMFSGGGLFGSGSTGKYGYASDAPEGNPFMS